MSLPVESHFFPAGSHIPSHILATQLDRIRIGLCDPIRDQGHVYIRLIGPDRTVNLHLALPRDASLVAEMHTSDFTLMQENSDVELFERSGRTCFVDICVCLRQLGLDKWRFSKSKRSTLYFGSRLWAYQIVVSLSLVGLFDLRAAGTEGPLEATWSALFSRSLHPYISNLETESSSLGLAWEALGTLNGEWQTFVPWRTRLEKQRVDDLENDEIEASQEEDTTQESSIGSETESILTMHMRGSIEAVRALYREQGKHWE